MPGFDTACTESARLTRRGLLRCGALSAAGLSLADLIRLDARAGEALRGTGKSVILLWMDGGASHFETFDPKVEAPAETRGEFAAIPTALPGVQFCEHLPRTAKIADRLAIIRSMTHQDGLHEGGHSLGPDGVRLPAAV